MTELADIVVINKADGATRAAASRAATAFKSTVHFHRQVRCRPPAWEKPSRLGMHACMHACIRVAGGHRCAAHASCPTLLASLPIRPPLPQRRQSWQPAVLTASAHTGLGIDKLQQQLAEYQAVMLHSGELAQVGLAWSGGPRRLHVHVPLPSKQATKIAHAWAGMPCGMPHVAQSAAGAFASCTRQSSTHPVRQLPPHAPCSCGGSSDGTWRGLRRRRLCWMRFGKTRRCDTCSTG